MEVVNKILAMFLFNSLIESLAFTTYFVLDKKPMIQLRTFITISLLIAILNAILVTIMPPVLFQMICILFSILCFAFFTKTSLVECGKTYFKGLAIIFVYELLVSLMFKLFNIEIIDISFNMKYLMLYLLVKISDLLVICLIKGRRDLTWLKCLLVESKEESNQLESNQCVNNEEIA